MLALLETLLTGLALVVAGRMVVYPFLAPGASWDWLARSWGGPFAIGATVTHWVVGAAIIGVWVLAARAARRKSL